MSGGVTPALRQALSDLLGYPISPHDKITDTIAAIQHVARERADRAPLSWQFGQTPELVVHVPVRGSWALMRLAGGPGQFDQFGDDRMTREVARALLRAASAHLDATEPTTMIGAPA